MIHGIPVNLEAQAQQSVDTAVQRIFTNAQHFSIMYPILLDWCHARGWSFHEFRGEWYTISMAEATRGKRGPHFRTFGDMIEWVLTDIENAYSD